LPDIPDFTKPSWQQERSDAKLLVSILDGKGQGMPTFRGSLNKDRARELVAQVRAFAPPTAKPGAEKQQEPASARDFENEFRRLREELERLKKQFREVNEVPPEREPAKPSKSPVSKSDSQSVVVTRQAARRSFQSKGESYAHLVPQLPASLWSEAS
jgi:hypothetical protein